MLKNYLKFILISTNHDEHTSISQKWYYKVLENISIGNKIIIKKTEFINDDAKKNVIINKLNEISKAKWFIHYGHGKYNAILGNDGVPIIDRWNLSNLKGMHVYCINCYSGQELGSHAIESGILEYWGYIDSLRWTSEINDIFGEIMNYGLIKAINEKKTLKEVFKETRAYGLNIANDLETLGKPAQAGFIVRAMLNLRLFSKDDVKFQTQNVFSYHFIEALNYVVKNFRLR
jgi:hypothetical protein